MTAPTSNQPQGRYASMAVNGGSDAFNFGGKVWEAGVYASNAPGALTISQASGGIQENGNWFGTLAPPVSSPIGLNPGWYGTFAGSDTMKVEAGGFDPADQVPNEGRLYIGTAAAIVQIAD